MRARGKSGKPPAQHKLIEARGPESLYDFHGLGDEDFEELCCALLYYEEGLENADLYGRPRQRQYGVDATANYRDGSGIACLSAKRYQSIGRGKIHAFAREFLDHWNTHWSEKRVRRFILCIACDLRSKERRKEVEAEIATFSELGIQFEAWGQRQLTHRARDNPAVARDYFKLWNSEAVLSSPSSLVHPSVGAGAYFETETIRQIGVLQSEIEYQAVTEITAAQGAVKRGERDKAEQRVDAIRRNPVRWSSLSSATKARVLRMQGSLALLAGDPERCRKFLDEADLLAPDEEPRARALLTLQTEGWDRALDVLKAPCTADGAMLRVGLLLESGRHGEARDVLTQWDAQQGKHPDWHRLNAYLLCIEGRPEEAMRETEIAESMAPDWTNVLESGAIVRYANALSPVVRFRTASLPEPVAAELARQDDASRAHLLEASERFRRLAEAENQPPWRQRFELWRFACLALLSDRASEAESACISLINQKPVPAAAVFWALARGYAFAHKTVISRMEAQLRGSAPSIDDLQAAVACALMTGENKKAAAMLARHAQRFTDPPSRKVIAHWNGRVALARGKLPAVEDLADPLDRARALISIARGSGNWSAIDRLLHSIADQPDSLLLVCGLLAADRQWNLVSAYASPLVDAVGTADAVRLVAYAWYNVGQFDRARELLDRSAGLFPGHQLPYELKKLLAYATARRGDLRSALPIAKELAGKTEEPGDQVLLIDLLLHIGDVEGAAPLVREVLPKWKGKPAELMRWIPSLATDAPELARNLVRMVLRGDIDPKHVGFVADWGIRLGLDEEAIGVIGRTALNTGGEGSSVRMASADEVIAYLRNRARIHSELDELYSKGAIPIHVVAGLAQINLAKLWQSVFAGDSESILFLRSGSRPTDFFAGQIAEKIALYVDITAILTMDQLGIFDVLDSAGVPITLPHTLPAILQALEQEARPRQPSRIALLEAIREGLSRGELELWPDSVPSNAPSASVVFTLSKSDVSHQNEVTLGALADELVRRGAVSADRIADVRKDRESWRPVAATADLARAEALIFEGNTIEVLVEADLLDAAKGEFLVRMTRDYFDHCLSELGEASLGNRTADRMRILRHRIVEGIRQGAYGLLPEVEEICAEDGTTIRDEGMLQSALELVRLPRTERAWIWIDDRYFTGYSFANGNPIVGTFEVLEHLRGTGRMAEKQYWAAVDRLRKSRAQILPIRAQEVIRGLDAAVVKEGTLSETPELEAVLARNEWASGTRARFGPGNSRATQKWHPGASMSWRSVSACSGVPA